MTKWKYFTQRAIDSFKSPNSFGQWAGTTMSVLVGIASIFILNVSSTPLLWIVPFVFFVGFFIWKWTLWPLEQINSLEQQLTAVKGHNDRAAKRTALLTGIAEQQKYGRELLDREINSANPGDSWTQGRMNQDVKDLENDLETFRVRAEFVLKDVDPSLVTEFNNIPHPNVDAVPGVNGHHKLIRAKLQLYLENLATIAKEIRSQPE